VRAPTHPAWRILAALVSLYLGGMLLYAALVKAADPGLFTDEIRGYKIFPALAGFGAYAFLWIEITLGVLLITGVLPRPALLGLALLMLFFIAVTGWAWAHGNASACGCFGRLAARPPGEVIAEDGAFVLLALAASWPSPWIRRSSLRWIATAVLLPVLLASPWVAPRLPVDAWITPLRPGANLENLAADDLKVPLGEGHVFVALLGDDCAACVDALPRMEALGRDERAPRITAIFSGDRAHKRTWTLKHVPTFPVAHSPERSLRQYYRRLPVFFLLDRGKVRRIWWNRMPDPAEVLNATE
jgi:uncharacterized membrane protein YphA (DoxX/SURF4 family)